MMVRQAEYRCGKMQSNHQSRNSSPDPRTRVINRVGKRGRRVIIEPSGISLLGDSGMWSVTETVRTPSIRRECVGLLIRGPMAKRRAPPCGYSNPTSSDWLVLFSSQPKKHIIPSLPAPSSSSLSHLFPSYTVNATFTDNIAQNVLVYHFRLCAMRESRMSSLRSLLSTGRRWLCDHSSPVGIFVSLTCYRDVRG